MPGAYNFNLMECGLWLIIAAILGWKSSVEPRKLRPTLHLLTLAFLLFAVSDGIEAHTGAWWKPLWLAALKGGCIAAFIWGFKRYSRLSKN